MKLCLVSSDDKLCLCGVQGVVWVDEYKYVSCVDVFPRRRHPFRMELDEHVALNTFFQFIETLSLKTRSLYELKVVSGHERLEKMIDRDNCGLTPVVLG